MWASTDWPLGSAPWCHLCYPEIRGELYSICGLKSLVPNNLTTWRLCRFPLGLMSCLSSFRMNSVWKKSGPTPLASVIWA